MRGWPLRPCACRSAVRCGYSARGRPRNASKREPRAIGGKTLPPLPRRGILILAAAFEPLRRHGGCSDALEQAAVPAIDSRALDALLRGPAGVDRLRGPMGGGA